MQSSIVPMQAYAYIIVIDVLASLTSQETPTLFKYS